MKWGQTTVLHCDDTDIGGVLKRDCTTPRDLLYIVFSLDQNDLGHATCSDYLCHAMFYCVAILLPVLANAGLVFNVSVCLTLCQTVCLSVCLSVCVSVCACVVSTKQKVVLETSLVVRAKHEIKRNFFKKATENSTKLQ